MPMSCWRDTARQTVTFPAGPRGTGPLACRNRLLFPCRRLRRSNCRRVTGPSRGGSGFFRSPASRTRQFANWRVGISPGWTSGSRPSRPGTRRPIPCFPTWRGRQLSDEAISASARVWHSTTCSRSGTACRRLRQPKSAGGQPRRWDSPIPARPASGPAWVRRSTRASRR